MRRKTLIFVALISLIALALLASSGKVRSQAYSFYIRLRGGWRNELYALLRGRLAELPQP